MKTFDEVKNEICGHPTLSIYEDLRVAVATCAAKGPFLQGRVTEMYALVGEVVGKTASAVGKSLSRVRDDIWDHGGDPQALAALRGRKTLRRLDPNELVDYLAGYFRGEHDK